MPISKSAKKALRSSIAKQQRNIKVKKNLDKALKKVSEKTFSGVISLIDKASKKGILHKNKASRMKSALAKKVDMSKIVKRQGSGVSDKKAPAKAKKKTKVSTKKKS